MPDTKAAAQQLAKAATEAAATALEKAAGAVGHGTEAITAALDTVIHAAEGAFGAPVPATSPVAPATTSVPLPPGAGKLEGPVEHQEAQVNSVVEEAMKSAAAALRAGTETLPEALETVVKAADIIAAPIRGLVTGEANLSSEVLNVSSAAEQLAKAANEAAAEALRKAADAVGHGKETVATAMDKVLHAADGTFGPAPAPPPVAVTTTPVVPPGAAQLEGQVESKEKQADKAVAEAMKKVAAAVGNGTESLSAALHAVLDAADSIGVLDHPVQGSSSGAPPLPAEGVQEARAAAAQLAKQANSAAAAAFSKDAAAVGAGKKSMATAVMDALEAAHNAFGASPATPHTAVSSTPPPLMPGEGQVAKEVASKEEETNHAVEAAMKVAAQALANGSETLAAAVKKVLHAADAIGTPDSTSPQPPLPTAAAGPAPTPDKVKDIKAETEQLEREANAAVAAALIKAAGAVGSGTESVAAALDDVVHAAESVFGPAPAPVPHPAAAPLPPSPATDEAITLGAKADKAAEAAMLKAAISISTGSESIAAAFENVMQAVDNVEKSGVSPAAPSPAAPGPSDHHLHEATKHLMQAANQAAEAAMMKAADAIGNGTETIAAAFESVLRGSEAAEQGQLSNSATTAAPSGSPVELPPALKTQGAANGLIKAANAATRVAMQKAAEAVGHGTESMAKAFKDVLAAATGAEKGSQNAWEIGGNATAPQQSPLANVVSQMKAVADAARQSEAAAEQAAAASAAFERTHRAAKTLNEEEHQNLQKMLHEVGNNMKASSELRDNAQGSAGKVHAETIAAAQEARRAAVQAEKYAAQVSQLHAQELASEEEEHKFAANGANAIRVLAKSLNGTIAQSGAVVQELKHEVNNMKEELQSSLVSPQPQPQRALAVPRPRPQRLVQNDADPIEPHVHHLATAGTTAKDQDGVQIALQLVLAAAAFICGYLLMWLCGCIGS